MLESGLLVCGGLGLFLLGMTIMTEGLQRIGGNWMRETLSRLTKSPASGAATGAVATALLQSSSATTVMAVGFSGAGLLTFEQSLGIIFGANIGTTMTGWLVALLGFKLQLTSMVLPLILVGAMMRLFGSRVVASVGYAAAGFGLVFAGIGMLQSAMEGMGNTLTPDDFPPDTVFGRLALVAIGIAITLVTQSSSAGVATAITAVHVGTITLPQAAAMVIGMDIGTTFTAGLATVGGSVSAKRTGIAHVVYNLLTGVGAFLMLPAFLTLWNRLAPESLVRDPEIVLVAFHTTFNGLGVLLALPFTGLFAGMIQRIVPTRDDQLTHRLDRVFLQQGGTAIDSVNVTLRELTDRSFHLIGKQLSSERSDSKVVHDIEEIQRAIDDTQGFANDIRVDHESPVIQSRYAAALHVMDHLNRLVRRATRTVDWQDFQQDQELSGWSKTLGEKLLESTGSQQSREEHEQALYSFWQAMEERLEGFRSESIQLGSRGLRTPEDTLDRLDAIRWLRRVSYHAWRIVHHLNHVSSASPSSQNEPPRFE